MKPIHYFGLLAMTLLPVVFGLAGRAQGVQLMPGAFLVENGSAHLVLHNASLVNDGVFSADKGTVVFGNDAGSGGSFIGGVNPVSFYNLTIGKATNDLILNNNAFVKGTITLDSGNLQLNTYLLDLGSTGSISGERNEARIIGGQGGTIRITAVLNGPHAVNPGNIGVEITSEANLGTTVITRGHIQLTNSDGETGIQRWFDIVPEVNTGLDASLRILYLEGELAGKDKNALTVFSDFSGFPGQGISKTWTVWGKDAASPNEQWVLKSNIDQLHRVTLAISPNSVLSKSGKTASMQIYPTPTQNSFSLQMVREKQGNGIICLFDATGHLLEEKRGYWQAGVTTINWDISKYPAGTYYLSFGNRNDGALVVVKQ